MKRPRIVIGSIVLAAIALPVGIILAFEGAISGLPFKSKQERAVSAMRSGATGIESYFVDYCADAWPDPGNVVPAALTTPIAYLTHIPIDPFSRKKEPIAFFNQGPRNGSNYMFASRGPDGVLDMARLPLIGRSRILSYKAEPGDVIEYDDGTVKTLTVGYNIHEGRYLLRGGQKIDLQPSEIRLLPPEKELGHGWPSLIAYLAKHDIAIYDPTNGARSQGDIVRTRNDGTSPYVR